MGYFVYVNDKPTHAADTLDEAKRLASPYFNDSNQLRIESLVAPAPSKLWIFDPAECAWVES